ncbi:hypothetical protein [Streptomyces viridochromogenes]|uniref:Uncharacterized protein n=1 Tax=Streptomyces viridochromogenes Tue57 TaxID=1160705 RepID=L8PBM3_STRVR|nr:hypothetical protein [Streptomyces viridochromogenes]ELS53569.1 hypothetical protein STVIR_5489 [Streptomyces viridochromogenes Tue57]
MAVLVLVGVLLIVVGGCVCVVWASRGGPRWVRAVAAVTLAAGELVRAGGSGRGSRSGSGSGSDGD